MPRARTLSWRNCIAALSLLSWLLPGAEVHPQSVWSGLTKTFTKVAGSNPGLPQNQDALTANVVLTRGATGGLINIAKESSFNPLVSPALTEWATDLNNSGKTIAAANWEELAFTDWLDAYGGQHTGGAFIANRDAVVHLVPDDIYLDLRFITWSTGSGGGYSYSRAEPPAMPPLNTGDYNGNGDVDAADYVLWRDTLDQMVTPPGSGADGDGSGIVDAADYDFWRAHFGETLLMTGSSAAVPEPGNFALLFIAAGLVALRRPRVADRRTRFSPISSSPMKQSAAVLRPRAAWPTR